MSKPQIIISGSIAIDRIMNFSGQFVDLIEPAKLDVLSVSVLVDSLKIAEGGTGANIAYNLASLGEKPVLLGSVGVDAAKYIERLSLLGVNTSRVNTSNLPTASFNVLTDSSDNQVGGFYPGAMNDSTPTDLKPLMVGDALFCLSAHSPMDMKNQIDQIKKHNLRLIFDPGQQVTNMSVEDLKSGIEAAEVLLVNEYEFGILCSRTGIDKDLLKKTVPYLVITHGIHGSLITGKDIEEPINIGIAKPNNIKDPTGAGDAYRAGFLFGYLRQWSLESCAKLGATLASFVLEEFGPQVKLSKENIIIRYKESFNEEIEI